MSRGWPHPLATLHIMIHRNRIRAQRINALQKRGRMPWNNFAPVVLPKPAIIALALGTALAAIFRGFDYLCLPQQPPTILHPVETVVDVRWWGVVFIAAGVMSMGGWFLQWWPVSILGRAALTGLYIAFAVSMISKGFHHVSGRDFRVGVDMLLVESSVQAMLVSAAWQEWDYVRQREQQRKNSDD